MTETAVSEIIMELTADAGPSGAEEPAALRAMELLEDYAAVRTDSMGSVIAELGDEDAAEHILLDAHMDEIGMVVTSIDDDGFLRVCRCGGVDRRVLPGSEVCVYGRKPLFGIIGFVPSCISSAETDKAPEWEEVFVDVGLPASEVRELVPLGSRIIIRKNVSMLRGGRITGRALDNRAGAAALIRCVQLLDGEKLPCRLTVLLSSREEIGGQGAKCAAFDAEPTQAIAVDVGFANQPGAPRDKCGDLGKGPMIGFYPVLSRRITERLCELADENAIPWQYDVGGSSSGTNADEIAVSRSGVMCGLLSIPQRNMHTQVEICDCEDIENTARLLAKYVLSCGAE